MQSVPPIRPETFESIVSPWLQGIRNKDIVAVVSYPASDRQRRLLNLQADSSLQKKYLECPHTYIWLTVDFRVDLIDNPLDLEECILRHLREGNEKISTHGSFIDKLRALEKKTGKKVILCCIGAESLLVRKSTAILIWTTIMCRQDVLRQIVFFETNLFSPANLDVLRLVSAFQPRIHILKLYDKKDSMQFIEHMSNEWHMKITPKLKEDIVGTCGGMFLFIKEALWYLRDHPNTTAQEVFGHTEMRFNLESLWRAFTDEEQVLLDAILLKTYEPKLGTAPMLQYLLDTGIVTNEHGVRITIELLSRYRKSILSQGKTITLAPSSELLLDSVPIGSHFSPRQRRLLIYFLTHPNSVISRETVGVAIWGANNDKYSDWALDSFISRLRIKLRQLGIDGKTLETKKGKGFYFHISI